MLTRLAFRFRNHDGLHFNQLEVHKRDLRGKSRAGAAVSCRDGAESQNTSAEQVAKVIRGKLLMKSEYEFTKYF